MLDVSSDNDVGRLDGGSTDSSCRRGSCSPMGSTSGSGSGSTSGDGSSVSSHDSWISFLPNDGLHPGILNGPPHHVGDIYPRGNTFSLLYME